MAKLNANDDNSWSMTAQTEEEALTATVALNAVLAHPELDSVEKINAYFAAQAKNKEESEGEA